MSNPTLTVAKGRVLKSELGSILIAVGGDLSAASPLVDAAGAPWYLPGYRSVAQTAGGTQTFSTSVQDDGTITFYLEGMPTQGASGGAKPCEATTSFAMLLDASGTGKAFPLQATPQGSIQKLTTKLAGVDLKAAREALFDANPNVAIQVTQSLSLAAQQTPDFIEKHWADADIQQGLLDLFGGIPATSAARFSSRSAQADSDFPNQFLVMGAVFASQVAAPALPGYLQYQVNWKDRAYNYYQDNQDRTRFFFLPERFEFAKGPEGAPTVSLLQFSVPVDNPSVDATRATFRLYGKPVVDFDRIQNAAQALGAKTGTTAQMVSLHDAHDVKTTFTQVLPNTPATDSSPAVQPNASIDLVAGLRNELNLNFAQFRRLWAAIFSSAPENPLFRGWIDVELSGGKFKERIDFDGRLPAAQEESFFDGILDTSDTGTFPARFTVKTFAKAFGGTPAVLEVGLTFLGAKSLTLTADKLESTTILERSVRDIVIGNQIPDSYPYKLQVVRDDGSISCGDGIATSDTPNLWITLDQIAKCVGRVTPEHAT